MIDKLCLVVLAAIALGAVPAGQTAEQTAGQQPRFRASVEVTSVDVAVVDNQGKPLVDLQPADFTVRVDGKSRRVITAEWVSLATASKEKDKPIARLPEGYSSNENSGGSASFLESQAPVMLARANEIAWASKSSRVV